VIPMNQYIDPHAHMVSRTTDDYESMRAAGIVAVIEPAFWLGQPRTSVGSFKDYFSMIVGWERFRAGQFGIRHYCTMGLNSKEANNERLAEEVMELLPLYVCKEGVVAIGEIGYDEMTSLEDHYFRKQLELARQLDMLVLIHTPHRNKKKGTTRSMDVCDDEGLDPTRVIIDHNNEETIQETLDRGYWAAFSIYPGTKMGNERMARLVQQYGSSRIIVDSACDWGVSDPLAVPKTARLMREMGVPEADIRAVCYENALLVYGKSGQIKEDDWLNPPPIDQRQLYMGNTVLRGGRDPLVETKVRDGDALIIK
jgi:uncharacterized protein